MEVNTFAEGSRARLDLSGKLTVQTAPDLEEALGALGAGVVDLEIDLAQVDYIASAGLRVLVAAQKMTTARGGSMVLANPNDDVYDVFEMTGLAEIFTIRKAGAEG